MHKASKVTVTVMAVGIATISLTAPVHAGNRSAVSAGTVGVGIGAVVGSALAPRGVCRSAAARLLRATAATCLLRSASATRLL